MLDRVEPGEAVEKQAAPVPGDRYERPVREAEDLAAGAGVEPVDAVLAVAEVDDAVDDRGRAGEIGRASCRERVFAVV